MKKRRLEGKRVALTGPRKAAEISKLIEKLGGIPLIRPLQGTLFLEDRAAESQLSRLIHEEIDWFIFTTGVGIEILYQAAVQMGVEQRFIQQLQQANIAGRGYKVAHALKKLGVELTVRDDDGTTAGLARALSPFDLCDRRVALQLYGDPASKLVQMLHQKGAQFQEILPYRHIPPETETLTTLLFEIIHGKIDAIAFTSGAQVRYLFTHARENGQYSHLLHSFSKQTVAVAVGKYTAGCLREEGVTRIVSPLEERIGSMVIQLAEFYQSSLPTH